MHNFRIYAIQKLFQLLLIIPMGLVVGCGDPDGPTDIMPLSVGNQWTYQNTTYYRNEPQTTWFDTVTVQVLTEMNVYGVTGNITAVFVLEGFYNVPSLRSDAFWLVGNRDDGLYLVGGINHDERKSLESRLIKYPYNEGESWSDSALYFIHDTSDGKGAFISTGEYEIRCIDTYRKINTPAGVFHCAVFHYSRQANDDMIGGYDFYDYYAPGVGVVRREMKDDGFLIHEANLLNYEVK